MIKAKMYNAAADLLERNLVPGRADKIAYIDDGGKYTYAELAEGVGRCANALREAGLERGQRIALCLLDAIDFPTCFLGAIKAGIVPIPLNTRSTAADFAAILADGQPQAAIVSSEIRSAFEEGAGVAKWNGKTYISGASKGGTPCKGVLELEMGALQLALAGPATPLEDECFWLYSSGSTGKPKGVIHRHRSLLQTAELFGHNVLGITEHDVIFSAPKLFFAYGLGNALTFPMSVGATTILCSQRPTPAVVNDILREHRPTIFFGVPTLFNALLASGDLPRKGEHALRFCVSAGEALPEKVGMAWREYTGVDIVDGIGSTEMLHIFVSNRPGAVCYGTTGKTVPGYRVRLMDETGKETPPGEIGELHVSGPTAALGYWNNAEKTRDTFVDNWVCTGDRCRQTPEGDYVHCGRSDDMLKVGGIYVSPLEVENALLAHEAILEAAVVGARDEMGLEKPKAFVVLRQGATASPALVKEIQQFVKERMSPYKYPRWIEIIPALPKTATGKVRRYALRNGSIT